MSGYRSLHRQQLRLQPDDENNDHDDATTAIWNVAVVEAQKGYRILTASSNGTLGIHHATEHSNASNKDLLDASAMKLDRQRPLLDGSSSQRCLGLTQVSVVRNYAGQDHAAGEFVILCLDLAGRIRLWTLSEEWVNTETTTTSSETAPRFQFDVPNATGTTACLAPPRIMDANHTTDVVVAVGCLDGTVSILSTGIATPNAKNDPSKAGTVLEYVHIYAPILNHSRIGCFLVLLAVPGAAKAGRQRPSPCVGIRYKRKPWLWDDTTEPLTF